VATRLTPIACILIGGFLYWAALGSDTPKAYFFPEMLALTMVVLGAGLLITDFRSGGKVKGAAIAIPWATIWPGMLVLALYMAFAQQVGFYLSAWLAFVSIAILYATPARRAATIRRSVPIAVVFLAVLYLVFWTLLRVQLPHGFAF
jgi:Tripartite tricarboxylate transporter TctB family